MSHVAFGQLGPAGSESSGPPRPPSLSGNISEEAAIAESITYPEPAFDADTAGADEQEGRRGRLEAGSCSKVLALHSDRLHRAFSSSRFIRAMSMGLLARIELSLLSGHKVREETRIVRQAMRGRESLMTGNEAYSVYAFARAQAAMPGVMAEVGVYQGVSARLISLASQGVPLHLFDTFEGLPEPGVRERGRLHRGQYAASLAGVETYLEDRPDVSLHKGLFPATTTGCDQLTFSFVHLDVDLESSTSACLDFFYPRMCRGGIILTHDFSYLPGVRKAFEGFLQTRPERAIELPTSQAFIVKA